MRHARCLTWAVLGVVAGCAAHAQEPSTASPATDGSVALLVQLLQAGGLPAVLGAGGWLLGRGGIPIHVELSATDRELLRSVSRRLTRALEADARTDESPKDDSEDR